MSRPPTPLAIVRRPAQSKVRNCLLASLSDNDFALISPLLEEMPLTKGAVIARPNQPIEHVYFPESAIVSVVAPTPDGHRIEVGIFGREGVSGTSVLLGVDSSPHEMFTQVEGTSLRIRTDNLRRVMEQSATFHQLLLRYLQVFHVQLAYTALSHGLYDVEARLARWLLMCQDRLDGNDLTLTHEFLAFMLGVRRAGVTEHIHLLEGVRAIKAKRSLITILDREKLLAAAGDSYGVPESEYERLIGQFRSA